MATILCSKSGIEFKCDHFPIHLTQHESHHPIFDVKLPRLWKYFPKWQAHELTETDSFLLFVAYLNATEMVEFRVACKRRPNTAQIIQANMEGLFHTIGRIITIKHPKFTVPRLVISSDTADLSNVRYWIQTWDQAYADFCDGLKNQELKSRLLRKEQGLERLIKNPSLNPKKYAHLLASWAAESAVFPEFMVDVNGNEMSCSDYWQEIIVKCHTDTNIISVPEKDLAELIEHCEEHLDGGSIQAHQLFVTVRQGMETLQGFFSIGSPSFSILNESDSVGDVNLKLLVDSAPLEMPKRTEYANEFQFIKAKMKYNLMQSQLNEAKVLQTVLEKL